MENLIQFVLKGYIHMLTFKEFLEKQLIKTNLFELAHNRQTAREGVLHLNYGLVVHFMKVALFPDSRDVPHWKQEIATWLREIDGIYVKPYGRKLKYSDYYELLCDGPIGHTDAVYTTMQKQYKSKKIPYLPDVDYEKVRLSLIDMYKELCDDLAIDKLEDVEKYIEMIEGDYK